MQKKIIDQKRKLNRRNEDFPFEKVQLDENNTQLLKQIKGHAVIFPINFLKDEDLDIKITDKEKLLGTDCHV